LKLLENGIGGCFYDLIKDLYTLILGVQWKYLVIEHPSFLTIEVYAKVVF
jgi:hypothetical protein